MYSLNSGIRRKIGQKREPLSNGGLLKRVAEKPREEFDRIQAASRQNDSDIVDDTKHGNDVTDSPDPISSLAPTNFTSRKPVKRSHAKFRERSGIDEMEDDLFLKDAPTITKSAVKLRSRQASVELRDRGYVKSLEVEPTPNFTGSGFLNALVAGKSTDEAAKEAQRKLLPDRTWAGYEKKRKPQRPTKGYGRSSANAATFSSRKTKVPSKTETVGLSDVHGLDKECTKRSTGLSERRARSVYTEDLAEENATEYIQTPDIKKFYNPLEHYQIPPIKRTPSPIAAPVFTDPMKKYPLPILKGTYRELGLSDSQLNVPVTGFEDPRQKYGFAKPPAAVGRVDKLKNNYRDSEHIDLSSSPPACSRTSTQSSYSGRDPTPVEGRQTKELVNEMAAKAGIANINAYMDEFQTLEDRPTECKVCHEPLAEGYLESQFGLTMSDEIRLDMWSKICDDHTRRRLENEWEEKGYPDIIWGQLSKRAEKKTAVLKRIVNKRIDSPYRSLFEKQQKAVAGNAFKYLQQDQKLPFPGYYGPRGGDILLQTLTTRLGSYVGTAADSDPLIARGGVSAFIQHVLVPEVAIRLIADDMKVNEETAHKILEDSREIGEKLNSDEERGDLYHDDDSHKWVDIAGSPPKGKGKDCDDDGWDTIGY